VDAATPSKDELTSEDVAWIRHALRELGSAIELVVSNITSRQVQANTPVHDRWLEMADVLGEDASQIFTKAHNSVHAVMLAAADHVKSFVAITGRPGTTLSTATMTRGAIEAFAKARYLIDASGAATFAQRYVALQNYELKVDDELVDIKDRPLDTRNHLKGLRDALTRHGIPSLNTRHDRVNITSMVIDVLEISADLIDGLSGRIYSQLSAIAHANTAGIGMYVHRTATGARLHLPRELVLEQAAMTQGVLLTVANRYINYHRPSEFVLERWRQVEERAKGR
jgi:hypothetical protein